MFRRTGKGDPRETPHLCVVVKKPPKVENAVNLESVKVHFAKFGVLEAVVAEEKCYYVSYGKESGSSAALAALKATALVDCEALGGAVLHVSFVVPAVADSAAAASAVAEPEPVPASDIPGLILITDFVDAKAESAMLESGQKKSLFAAADVPEFCVLLCKRLAEELKVDLALDKGFAPDTVATSGLLQPGMPVKSVAESHSAFRECVALLTLGGSCVMDFARIPRAASTSSAGSADSRSVFVPARSLLVLTGEVRFHWSYSVPSRTRDTVKGVAIKRDRRVALTFRQKRAAGEACGCSAVLPSAAASSGARVCADSNNSGSGGGEKKRARGAGERESAGAGASAGAKRLAAPKVSESKLTPQQLEQQHVVDVYNAIAEHFSNTRHSPWPKIERFVRNIPAHSLVADVGAGNGKYMGLNPSIRVIGSDISDKLVGICHRRGYEVLVADALRLPYRSAAFDYVISIAVLHHISTVERRMQMVSELLRVLRPGGRVLVSAWALEQEDDSRRTFDDQDVFVPWNLKAAATSAASTGSDAGEQKGDSKRSLQESKQSSTSTSGGAGAAASASSVGGEATSPSSGSGADGSSGGSGGSSSLAPDVSAVFQRYCHVYVKGELESLFERCAAPAARVVDSFYDKGNWCVVAQREGGDGVSAPASASTVACAAASAGSAAGERKAS